MSLKEAYTFSFKSRRVVFHEHIAIAFGQKFSAAQQDFHPLPINIDFNKPPLLKIYSGGVQSHEAMVRIRADKGTRILILSFSGNHLRPSSIGEVRSLAVEVQTQTPDCTLI
jgi:hypothetical protein